MRRLVHEFDFKPVDLERVDDRVRGEVDAATDEAEKSPFPEPLDALVGVYADRPRERPLWFRNG